MSFKNTKLWKYAKKKRAEHTLKREYLHNKKMPFSHYEEYLVNRTVEMMQRYDYSKPFAFKVDFSNPVSYTEKMQWLKLYDQNQNKTRFTDKYEVRKYVEHLLGKKYLVELISIDGKDVFDNAKEIDFNKLPNQFVLKCTHGSHMNIVVENKSHLSSLDIRHIIRKLNGWLKINYAFWVGLELQYLSIKPRIIIEKYIGSDGSLPKDYKFFCYENEVKFLSVNENRGTKNYSETYLDLDFKRLPYAFGYYSSNESVQKPNNYLEMLKIANILCVGFKHVRVDLYEINDEVFFGELTFSPGAGFDFPKPFKFDKELGSLINIDNNIRILNKTYRIENNEECN